MPAQITPRFCEYIISMHRFTTANSNLASKELMSLAQKAHKCMCIATTPRVQRWGQNKIINPFPSYLFFINSPILPSLTQYVPSLFFLVLNRFCVNKSWQNGRRDQCWAGLSVLWPSSHTGHEQGCLGGSDRCTTTCADRKGWQRFN